jgi:hypothetical protein
MRTPRVPGLSDIARLVNDANERVVKNDSDQNCPKVLTITPAMTSTQLRRAYLLSHLRLGNTEIVRISTPLDASFSEYDMTTWMDMLTCSHVWGLNMGEFKASDAAWRIFADKLQTTLIGFVWINERGKDIGASNRTHEWLLGTSDFAQNGVLRGKHSVLARNRLKYASWTLKETRPWFDSSNPTLRADISRKFLFNPHNSKLFA